MARWLVKLEGNSFDLDEFPYWFRDGPVFALADSDGTYLAGELLEAQTDATTVHDESEHLLDEMHAAIALLDPGIRRPSIGVVLREDDFGVRTGTAFLAGVAHIRTKARGNLSVLGEERPLSSETQAQFLLRVARLDRHLRIALSLLAMPHVSWPHLYRALEEIEASLHKSVSAAEVCTNNERDRFTRSANSGEIAGSDARHRVGKFAPPARPMTLKEAQAFIRRCLETTLRRSASAA